MKWCPLNDEVLINTTWLTFDKCLDVSFNSVKFFMHHYPQLFNGITQDSYNGHLYFGDLGCLMIGMLNNYHLHHDSHGS